MSAETNNQVVVLGTFASELTLSHEVFGERFYHADLAVSRLSDSVDLVPLLVPEKLLHSERAYLGCTVKITGQFRSYNRHDVSGSKLILSVFVQDMVFVEEALTESAEQTNQILMQGYLCKDPIYRKTPLGREIADLMVAVNRAYGKSDYIPCICWGKNARYVSDLEIGSKIWIQGRIQSREYQKKTENRPPEKRVAYEVSVMRVRVGEKILG